MSELSDLMASDMAALHATGFDLATAATLTACDGATTGPVVVVFGDDVNALAAEEAGYTDGRTISASVIRSAAVAILTRDPVQGDILTVTAGANAGAWIVSTATADDGDGLVMSLRRDVPHTLGRAVR